MRMLWSVTVTGRECLASWDSACPAAAPARLRVATWQRAPCCLSTAPRAAARRRPLPGASAGRSLSARPARAGVKSLLSATASRQLSDRTAASLGASYAAGAGLGLRFATQRLLSERTRAEFAWTLGPAGEGGISLSLTHKRERLGLGGRVEVRPGCVRHVLQYPRVRSSLLCSRAVARASSPRRTLRVEPAGRAARGPCRPAARGGAETPGPQPYLDPTLHPAGGRADVRRRARGVARRPAHQPAPGRPRRPALPARAARVPAGRRAGVWRQRARVAPQRGRLHDLPGRRGAGRRGLWRRAARAAPARARPCAAGARAPARAPARASTGAQKRSCRAALPVGGAELFSACRVAWSHARRTAAAATRAGAGAVCARAAWSASARSRSVRCGTPEPSVQCCAPECRL